MQNLIIQGLIDNRSTLNEHNCWQSSVSYFMFVLPSYMFLCANVPRKSYTPQEGLLLKTNECIPPLTYTRILGATVKNVVMH